MPEYVVLVDEQDKKIGVEEKIAAHKKGLLHRAFSIFIFNSRGQMLIQKRAAGKYHSAGLWSNTCCSHPRPDEPLEQAVQRRLQEEMGFTCPVKEVFSFVYKIKFDDCDLFEHELDHVLIGIFDGQPEPDPDEASDFKWVDLNELEKDVQEYPEQYAHWFKLSLKKVIQIFQG